MHCQLTFLPFCYYPSPYHPKSVTPSSQIIEFIPFLQSQCAFQSNLPSSLTWKYHHVPSLFTILYWFLLLNWEWNSNPKCDLQGSFIIYPLPTHVASCLAFPLLFRVVSYKFHINDIRVLAHPTCGCNCGFAYAVSFFSYLYTQLPDNLFLLLSAKLKGSRFPSTWILQCIFFCF